MKKPLKSNRGAINGHSGVAVKLKSDIEEITLELWKLDQWIQNSETRLLIHLIFNRKDQAHQLSRMVKQAHVYAGKFRTIRAERLGHWLSNP
jgi:hypothetical protein